jgi:hypothetical protein
MSATKAWVITLDRDADGELEPYGHGCRNTVREANDLAVSVLDNDADLLAAFVIEESPHVSTLFSGNAYQTETRYRLASQSWRRKDGHIDTHTTGLSETPWGSVA